MLRQSKRGLEGGELKKGERGELGEGLSDMIRRTMKEELGDFKKVQAELAAANIKIRALEQDKTTTTVSGIAQSWRCELDQEKRTCEEVGRLVVPNEWRGRENERVLSKVTELDEQVLGLKEDVVALTRQKEMLSMWEQQREKEWRREVDDQKKELVAEQALSKRWREKSAVDSEARKREEMHYAKRVIDWQREEGLLKKEMVVWKEIAGKVKEGMDVDLVGDTLRHATSLRISELEEQVDALKIEVVKWKGKAKDQNSTVLQTDREEEVEGRNIGVPLVKSASGASGTNKEGDTAGSYWGRCVDTERGQNVKGQNPDTQLAWGKSRSEHIGSKRKSEEVEHPYAKNKRRGSGVAHAFLFGDSQIRPLTTELELVATAHVKGWEVRMRRGGVLANSREMIESEADQMRGVKWAMLLVGGQRYGEFGDGGKQGGEVGA